LGTLTKGWTFAGNGKFSQKPPGRQARWKCAVLKHIISVSSIKRALPAPANLGAFFGPPCDGKVDRMKTTEQLSRKAIEEFKTAYEEEFGQTLADDEVREIANRLLRFFGILKKK
jgi:hypothetical protein